MKRKPDWLKVNLPSGDFNHSKEIIAKNKVFTVCKEAACPNIAECYGRKIATFLILGDICSRNCKYCNVIKGKPIAVDKDEPFKIANTVKELNLKYSVITSVTRDDLPDGGASHFVKVINALKGICKVEVLAPDFNFVMESVDLVICARPDVFAHNIELTKNIFNDFRIGSYDDSIQLLSYASKKIITKSGIMIGLGESENDILSTMKDLKEAGVSILVIGQYLQPRKDLMSVKKYYSPKEFIEFEKKAYSIGFRKVLSSPLARSSYLADLLHSEIIC
jgi:lipoyl synthase